MHRPLWERAIAAFMAIWLAVVVAEPAFLHACPMHGGQLAVASTNGAQHSAGHMHGAASAPSNAPAQAPAHHQCTCLGDCGLGPSVAVPASIVASIAPITTIRYQLAYAPSEYTPDSPATLLPFANGPPSQA
jgi:hypothetical protein